MFALPPRDMCDIYHIHCFYLGGKLLLSPCVRLTRLLVIVVAWRPLSLVFGVKLADLFEDPTIYVAMIGGFIGGTMNLARPIEYSV